jgi:hypothetical protein
MSRIDEIRELLRDAGAVVCVNDPDAGAKVEIRFAELEDAQRLHKTLVQAPATAPTETGARCVRCGHSRGNQGCRVCASVGEFCPCVFPASTEQAGERAGEEAFDASWYLANEIAGAVWKKRVYLRGVHKTPAVAIGEMARIIEPFLIAATPATPVAQPEAHPVDDQGLGNSISSGPNAQSGPKSGSEPTPTG